MRYDRASAVYADFGPFYTGLVAPLEDVLAGVGLG
jgi:chlorite dismutase